MGSYVANLKKQMQCSLCNDTLIEPKLVTCFHVFCKQCIKRNAEVDKQDYIFKCPQCNSKSLLQDLNDVEDLETSPVHSRILKGLEFVENQKTQKHCSVSSSHPEALWQCIECDRSLCEECLRCHSSFFTNHEVVSLSDLKKEDIDKLLKKEALCSTHDNQNVELYCQDCDVLICLLCLKEHHQNHKTKAIQDVIAIETDSLSKNLEQINKITTDEKEKMQQEQITLKIKRDGEKAKQKVKELTDNLVKKLRKNEQQLLSEIQESITRAERNLRIINHYTQAQEYIKYFIDNSTASEMIDSRLNKSKQTLAYKPFPKTIHGVEFVPNQALSEKVNCGLGLLRISFKQPDPKVSSIKVVPSELKTMIKAKLVVELKTSKAEVAGEHLENVAIQFTPEDDVKVEEIQMTDDGEITVDFVPRVPGQLTADIKLRGNPVCNSPLVMLVKPQQIKEITEHSKLKDALNTGSMDFTGIAVNRTNSKIAVTDWKSQCVRVFNMEGDLLLTYGSEGQGQRQLNRPEGLAFLNNTDLVISEYQGNQIHIVNTITGQPVRTFGCHGNGDGQFKGPRAVHVDEDSNIIVCDCSNQRVQVFTKHGDYLYQFSLPDLTHSTVKHNQKFYVSTNQAVHVIKRKDNQSCTTVGTISVKDYTDGPLERAWGLTIDNNNNLLVCDFRGCLIHKFTLDGRYMGRSDKLANGPRYIAVLPDGEVICTTEIGVVCFKN